MPAEAASTGEVAAITTAAIGGMALFGKGIAWLTGWSERRDASRSAKLQKWHDELEAREKAAASAQANHWSEIEKRLAEMEQRHSHLHQMHSALRLAFELVAGELRSKDPLNGALKRAEQLLQAVFPMEICVPPDVATPMTIAGLEAMPATRAKGDG